MSDSAEGALAGAHFVIVGAGGLGCPALFGLQAGGARRLTIIDDDRVDASNLQRQVLYSSADVGSSKARSAAWSLRSRSPRGPSRSSTDALAIEVCRERLDPQDPELVRALVGSAGLEDTVVLECSDSPSLKFAVHDACVAAGVPVVVGGVVGWGGQAMAVDPRRPERACYRCLFESPPPAEFAPACASVGVVGAVAGVIGQWMASLALGMASDPILFGHRPGNLKDPQSTRESKPTGPGVLIHFDLLNTKIQRLEPKARENCPHHGAAAQVPSQHHSGPRV